MTESQKSSPARAFPRGDLVLAGGSVELRAAEGGEDGKKRPARIELTAYAGGLMTVPGWGPLAVDLDGLELPAACPLLADHGNELSAVAGQVAPKAERGKLVASGVVTRATPAGELVIGLARDGVQLQASVGVKPTKTEFVKAGASLQVNGQALKAPDGGCYLVHKGELREISILPLGADGKTSVRVAARGRREENRMDGEGTETRTVDPVEDLRARSAAESQRIADVQRLCAGRHAEIEAKAIGDGWDVNRTSLELLRAERPKASGPGYRAAGAEVGTVEFLASSLLVRAGREDLALKAYGERAVESARRARLKTALDLADSALAAAQMERPAHRDELIRAAFSTTQLPVAILSGAEKILLEQYAEPGPTWPLFARVISVTNFRPHSTLRPAFLGGLERVPPGGEIKHTAVTEAILASLQAETFGRLASIDRQTIVNDDLGVFLELIAAFGTQARRAVSDLVWGVILANAGDFFAEGNGNLLTGQASALSMSALTAAVTALRTQRDADKNDLDIVPRALVVPPELEALGRALLQSTEIRNPGADADYPTGNALAGVAQLGVEPRISNASKFAKSGNASQTAWYLAGGPSAAPVVVAFLNGQQTPTLENLGLSATPNLLAWQVRVYFDFGAALCDDQAIIRSDGT